jgi:hypothetical protein
MDAVSMAQAGSLEAIEQARRMDIPERLVHLFSGAGLAAVEAQRKAWDERTSRPGAFGLYCETVASACLQANGYTTVARAA